MNVSTHFDGSTDLKQHRLLHEDVLDGAYESENVLLLQFD